MKGLKHKLNGFTIIEMLVTLALTSIVLTVSYSGFHFIQKLFIQYKEQNAFVNKCLRLQNKITREINSSFYLRQFDENTFKFVNDTDSLKLTFEVGHLIVTSFNQIDTLEITNTKPKVRFNKDLLDYNIVDSLSFTLKYKQQTFDLTIAKQMESDVKLKLMMNNVAN